MDLSTVYLGIRLPHPCIAGASPLSDSLDAARRLEDAGAAAIVMRSLFEEQIHAEAMATHFATESHAYSYGEALTYLPEPDDFVLGPDAYLEQLRRVKEAVNVPVIASLNGQTSGGWLDYASLLAHAGADAIELNIYYVASDPFTPAEAIEHNMVEMIAAVKRAVRVPVAVKLSPFYTSFAHLSRQLDLAGADGLVIFNRYYEPDIDVEELSVQSHLVLSDSSELRLRLRWLAILSEQVRPSLAITGGVHTAIDAIKAVMCGAHAVQVVSALLKNGPDHLTGMIEGMRQWMVEREYESVAQMRGSMNRRRCPNPEWFERANYMHMLQTWCDVTV